MPLTTVNLHAYALMNAADAAKYLKIAAPTGDELTMLHRMINAATDQVEQFCHRPFVSRSFNETYDGNGQQKLPLNYFPIVSVTTLDYLNDADGAVLFAYASGDFRIDSQHGFLYHFVGNVFYKGERNWRVVYTPGWNGLTAVPNDVVLAALMLMARKWRDYDKGREDIESVTFEGQTTVLNKDGIPPKVKSLLNSWRLPPTGSL